MFSLIVWRHNGDPSEPAVIHLLTRLMYGLSCSGFLSEKGLMLIADTAIKNCTICSGGDRGCEGIAHEFYCMLESSYLDYLPYSVDTKERRDELIAYSIHMLSQFGYSTKGFDGNELSSKHNETLPGITTVSYLIGAGNIS